MDKAEIINDDRKMEEQRKSMEQKSIWIGGKGYKSKEDRFKYLI